MKKLLTVGLLVVASFAWAGEGAAPHAALGDMVQGEVLDVKNVENFSYLLLKTRVGENWAAVVNSQVKKGDHVTIEDAVVMQNFESKALQRTFKTIVFGTLGGASAAPAAPSALGESFAVKPGRQLESINDAPIAKASGANAMTVAEIVANSARLKDKPVLVRGRVVKYNAEIMGKNWLHLRDGSGSAANETNDILVTTTGKAKVGDIVTVKGVVHTDQDFGAGYAYQVLIGEAALQR